MDSKAKNVVGAAGLFLFLTVFSMAYYERETYRNLDTRECPILDTPHRTGWGTSAAFTLPAGTTGWGDSLSVTDLGVWARFLNWENEFGSEIEAQVRWDLRVLEGFPNQSGLDAMYSLSMARVFVQWSQRYMYGYGMQVHASPGLYAGLDTFDSDGWTCPAGLTLIKAFTPNFAVFAGAEVFPHFEHRVDPRLGLLYAVRDDFVFQLAYPESRLEFSPSPDIRFLLGGSLLLWPEYNLDKSDVRERLQFEEGRAYAGIDLGITPYTWLTLRGGYAFRRTIGFEVGSDMELDDAPFFMIGISGRL